MQVAPSVSEIGEPEWGGRRGVYLVFGGWRSGDIGGHREENAGCGVRGVIWRQLRIAEQD